jgi:hypothetical protein
MSVLGRLFPSFEGRRYTSPYFYIPPKRRWWPFLAAFAAGGACVLALTDTSSRPEDPNRKAIALQVLDSRGHAAMNTRKRWPSKFDRAAKRSDPTQNPSQAQASSSSTTSPVQTTEASEHEPAPPSGMPDSTRDRGAAKPSVDTNKDPAAPRADEVNVVARTDGVPRNDSAPAASRPAYETQSSPQHRSARTKSVGRAFVQQRSVHGSPLGEAAMNGEQRTLSTLASPHATAARNSESSVNLRADQPALAFGVPRDQVEKAGPDAGSRDAVQGASAEFQPSYVWSGQFATLPQGSSSGTANGLSANKALPNSRTRPEHEHPTASPRRSAKPSPSRPYGSDFAPVRDPDLARPIPPDIVARMPDDGRDAGRGARGHVGEDRDYDENRWSWRWAHGNGGGGQTMFGGQFDGRQPE